MAKKTNLSEAQLVHIATTHQNDKIANRAMEVLKERYDQSYVFCLECDGLAVKASECCLNRSYPEDDVPEF